MAKEPKINGGKKIKKIRVIVGIACIVLAAIVCFVGIPVAVRMTTQTVPVLVATKNLSRGERITAENATLVQMGQEGLPDTVMNNYPLADIPVYAKMEIAANNFILANNTTKTAMTSESLTALPDGKVAISFTFQGPAASFDNQFQAGDIVQFLCYYGSGSYYSKIVGTNERGEGTVVQNKLLSYVKLHSVNNEYGTEIKNSDKDEVRYSYATVIVTPEQAEEIVRLEHEGAIHLSLIYRYDGSSNDKTDAYVATQDAYIASLKNKTKTSTNTQKGE